MNIFHNLGKLVCPLRYWINSYLLHAVREELELFFSVQRFRAWIQIQRYLPNNQSKMPKPRLFRCHSVFSICYSQVLKAFTWCIMVLRCPVLPIFSSGLKVMVSARRLTFLLDLAPTSVSWTQTSAGTPHWGALFIIFMGEFLQGIYQLMAPSTCLTWIISKHHMALRNSQPECCTPTRSHLQCLIPSAAIMMCLSGFWEYRIKYTGI